MITVEYLKQLFNYSDGNLYYKKPRCNIKVGNKVGNLDSKGYLRTCIDYKEYRVHRLIWFYHYGEWPMYLDHINGDRLDNRIENLRPCSMQENNFNRKSLGGSSSQYKGVSQFRNKWRARFTFNGKEIHIGTFDTELEAAKAYDLATANIHKNFQRKNYEQ